MIFFVGPTSSVMTAARPTSEPVPAVVGTARTGALRGSRALVLERAEALWDAVTAERKLTIEERALFQIACADAAQACAEAVDGVVEAAGTTANTVGSPLERCARDSRVIRQHVTVAPQTLEDGGRVLLGLEPDSLMLKLPS